MTHSPRRRIAYLSLACAFAVFLSITTSAAWSEKKPIKINLASHAAGVIDFERTAYNNLVAAKGLTREPFALSAYNLVMQQTPATVSVDCTKGHSINSALTQHPNARELIVEISGMCQENVVVRRDRVTLRGTDPTNDGIQALVNSDISEVALWVREAQLVTVENLKLTGGFSGLLATNVTLTNLRVINCRLDNNRAYGAQLQNALVEAQNSTFSSNGNINAGVFSASRLQCTGCTFADPAGTGPLAPTRDNVLAFGANRVLLIQSTLTNGGITSDDSFILAIDTSIAGFVPGGSSIFTNGSSSIAFTRVQVSGNMLFNQGTTAQLLGVTQPGPASNLVEDRAFVRIGDASRATGGPPSIPSAIRGFNLRNFSKATLLQTSTITGNLNCSQGADAFCSNPANVSGTSNCVQCP